MINYWLKCRHQKITPVVVEVVVAHTGYPADFIELDQDLEGELGIDTVKQARLWQIFVKSFPTS